MQKDTQPDNSKGSFSKVIAILRDSVLLTGSVLYVTGYIVWSIQAYKNNLGLLPLIDSQYFVAGFLPVVTFMLLIALLWGVWTTKKLVQNHLDRSATGWKRFIRLALFAFAIFGIFGAITSILVKDLLSDLHYVIIGFINICLLLVGLIFLPPIYLPDNLLEKFFPYGSSQKSHKFLRAITIQGWNALREFLEGYSVYITFLFVLLSVGLALFGIRYFINDIHPNVYQEFGGSKPRCAQLDISADKLSENIRQALFENPIDYSAGVIQTKKLLVFYAGNDFLLVKPRNPATKDVYEIRKDIIHSILWCND